MEQSTGIAQACRTHSERRGKPRPLRVEGRGLRVAREEPGSFMPVCLTLLSRLARHGSIVWW